MTKGKAGRKSVYTKEKGKLIFDEMCRGKTILSILKENPELPARSTVYHWRKNHDDFREMFEEARMVRIEVWADECFAIADDDSNDLITTEKGVIANNAAIRRAELRINLRKFFVERQHPSFAKEKDETTGPVVQIYSVGTDGEPIN